MIELKNVCFSYSGRDGGGLNHINLKVQDGECILLCGPSGCGKTTISRLINGLIPRYFTGELTGNVLLNGREVSDMAMFELSECVGSVFQNPRTQFFNTDTDSEIAFGLENKGKPPTELRRRVETVTGDMGLEDVRGHSLHALSGGEKQKIAFASVYAMDQDVYLLDEPSSNLDMDAIQELKEHLELIKKQGKTIVIAEHRLYYLMELADRVIYLESGRIVREYTPKQFMALPDSEREQMGLRAADLSRVHPAVPQYGPVPAALELRDVGLYYNKVPIVENINIKAGASEIIGVLGHNGAGKTTFSRALCGLHRQTSGEFIWKGRVKPRKERLRQSYMVMQDVNFQLFADSVESECSFGIQDPDLNLAASTLDKLGLTPYRTCHPNTLSGGQKQRLAVAVSMICGKEILVFDEPTSGLDFDSMVQVADLVKKLAAMGKVIFIVTHDYEFICRTCSRVLYIDKGEGCFDLSVSAESEGLLQALLGMKNQAFNKKGVKII